jgi:hypothetical protein
MSKINTGGPAFPHHETTSTGEPFHDHFGMSIRDYFAAQALPGVLQLVSSGPMRLMDGSSGPITEKHVAETAYGIADAMMAAREKEKE